MRNLMTKPTSAFVAVTLCCNSRCVMCDIWRNKKREFLDLEICKKLSSSLENIDITGGEPFLHPDLPEIVKTLREACPRARLLITTNGLLPEKINKVTQEMLCWDKNLVFRVSLDGWGRTHDKVRGIPGAFQKAIESIKILKNLGVRDLGIIFTLMKLNINDLNKILDFCKKEKLQFSLNLVHNSEIYFGGKHLLLRPTLQETKKALTLVKNFYKGKISLKSLAKIWFYDKLLIYSQTGKRPIPCGAGENFFYLDSRAKVYPCHFKNWNIGNLKDQSFESIWHSKRKAKYLESAENCQDCFMVCTTKAKIGKNRIEIIKGLFLDSRYSKN